MSKATKLAGATAVVAQGPAGIRRLAAGCLVVVLLGVLAVGGLLAFAAWSARHQTTTTPLPCPPDAVAVAYSTRDVPQAARAAVAETLREAGRTSTEVGWDPGQRRHLVIVWTPGSTTTVSTTSDPVRLTLGAIPTAAEVTEALGARLAPCEAPSEPGTASAPAEPQESGQGAHEGISWPWERGLSLTGGLAVALAVWWLVGPNVVRATGRVLWPLRLGWRRGQRSRYRRRLARGEGGAVWPERMSPGQRWHESAEAMHDHRTLRSQTAEREGERRASLREAIRAERLAGDGVGPVSLWRRIYRLPEGTPESEGVSR